MAKCGSHEPHRTPPPLHPRHLVLARPLRCRCLAATQTQGGVRICQEAYPRTEFRVPIRGDVNHSESARGGSGEKQLTTSDPSLPWPMNSIDESLVSYSTDEQGDEVSAWRRYHHIVTPSEEQYWSVRGI